MKILCLYNNECARELFEWIREQGHEIVMCDEKITSNWCQKQKFDLGVSYTYRHILSKAILQSIDYNIVNLHNSFLPWNRGADPNLWSILEETPRGVTLHYMDENLDQGYVIAQRFVPLGKNETFKSSYYALDRTAKCLFKEAFLYYPYWSEMKKKVMGTGNYHSLVDGERVKKDIGSYDMDLMEYKKRDREF